MKKYENETIKPIIHRYIRNNYTHFSFNDAMAFIQKLEKLLSSTFVGTELSYIIQQNHKRTINVHKISTIVTYDPKNSKIKLKVC